MNFFQKIKWRLEKYLIDPIVSLYLRNRLYENYPKAHGLKVFVADKNKISRFFANKYFQCIITSSNLYNIYEAHFEKSYLRGLRNDPQNHEDLLRYRVYINSIIAKLASKQEGDFCTVGVSWGIVPRTIFEYLNIDGFWDKKGARKYYLIDKWEQILFAGMSDVKQPNYCGDFEHIKKEFFEDNYKIIKEYAPQACEKIDTKLSYLHLNTGDKKSEYETVRLLWGNITSPGYIIIDNYYYSDQEESIDGFLREVNSFVLPLGNSQGIVIKT